jgi:MYXO-CTERM domain-containing protein
MKKILLLAALLGTAVTTFGQGVVLFNNRVTASGVDAPILNSDGTTRLAGTGFRAALYGVGGSVASDAALDNQILQNLSGTATWVDLRTGAAAGYVNVGTDGGRIFSGVGYNQAVTVQIRAWEGNFATYEQALASGAKVGKSNLVPLTTTTSATDPVIPPMVGLQSFSLVPEPSSIALGLLGLGALALIRRRK